MDRITLKSTWSAPVALASLFALLFTLGTLTAHGAVTGTLMPISVGTYSAWTPSTGSIHYTLVDETTCNGITDYVSTAIAGNRDSFGVSLASVPNGATITNIQLAPCASRSAGGGGGSATLNVFYRYNGVNSGDQGSYALTGTTPANLASSNFASLSLVKGSTSTLEVGAVYTSGTKGARLSRLATVITYTPQAPNVTTQAASSVGVTTATLNGSVNPNGGAATGWFRYSTTNPGSCSDSFGTRSPLSGGSALGAGTSSVNYAQGVSGLSGNTTYYYCAIGNNVGGTTTGAVQSFVTSPVPVPSVTTVGTLSVTASSSLLRGQANPNGYTTTGWFRYSTTNPGTCDDTFGTRAPVSGGTSLGGGTSTVLYSESVLGLSEATTYYFCALASNSGGTSFGSVLSFTTLPATAPSAPTGVTATNVSGTENTITWTDVATNESAYFIERSQNGGSYVAVGSTTANATSFNDTGATADQTYQYRVRAYNTVGYSSYTQSNQVVTATVVPSAPTITWTFVSTSTPAQVYLGWSHSGNNEDGFRIERSTDNVNFTVIGTSSRDTSDFGDGDVLAGTYYYKVHAYNAVGNSTDSNTETVVVP